MTRVFWCNQEDVNSKGANDEGWIDVPSRLDTTPFLMLTLLVMYHQRAGLKEDVNYFVKRLHPKLRELADQMRGADRHGIGFWCDLFHTKQKPFHIWRERMEYRRWTRPTTSPSNVSPANQDGHPRAPFVMFKQIPNPITLHPAGCPNKDAFGTLEAIKGLLDAFGISLSDEPTLPLGELGLFLRRFRGHRSRDSIVDRIGPSNKWSHRDFEEFEKGQKGGRSTMQDLKPLLDAYGARPILVEWMAAKPVSRIAKIASFSGATKLGFKCTYQYPQARLADVDVAFAQVEIAGATRADIESLCDKVTPYIVDSDAVRKKIPHSDQHAHPGDELIYVLRGCVEVHLGESGTRERLRQGDYCHFQASERHVVWNPSDLPANVLVIRFYQIRKHSTHSSLYALLGFYLDGFLMGEAQRRSLRHWLIQISRLPAEGPDEPPTQVADILGLVRRVELFSAFRSGKEGYWKDSVEFWTRVASGEEGLDKLRGVYALDSSTPGTVELLEDLARMFGIPRVLLDDVLVPPSFRRVFVRADDWVRPPDFKDECGSNATYWLPRRSLIGSDIAINRLCLEPKASGKTGRSPRNDHPGSELLLCINGSAQLQYHHSDQRTRTDVSIHKGELVHYLSEHPHAVVNSTTIEKTELLVIRFYDSSPMRQARPVPEGD